MCLRAHEYFSDSPFLSSSSVSQMKESNSQDDFKVKVQLLILLKHTAFIHMLQELPELQM